MTAKLAEWSLAFHLSLCYTCRVMRQSHLTDLDRLSDPMRLGTISKQDQPTLGTANIKRCD